MNIKTILISLIILLYFASYGQNDYVNYHLKCYHARKMKYEGKLDSAILDYKVAFKLVDYVHLSVISDVQSLLEIKSDDSLKKYNFAKIALYKPSHELDNVLDSLKNEDQRIRGDVLMAARNTYLKYKNDSLSDKSKEEFIQSEKLMKEWWHVDSSNP